MTNSINIVHGIYIIIFISFTSVTHSEQKSKTRKRSSELMISNFSSSENNSLFENCPFYKYHVEPFKLPDYYNKFEIPTSRANPDCEFERLPVTIGVRLRNIRGVVELNEEISMELDLITAWKDYVLENILNKTGDDLINERGTHYIALESSFINEIWQPDIIFSKAVSIEKHAVHATRQNFKPSKLRIHPGAWMELSTRLVVTLYCPMDFKYFPLDTQTCNIRLRSYTFSDEDINLEWNMQNSSISTDEKIESVFFYGRTHPNYIIYLHDVLTDTSTEEDINGYAENYTVLQFSLSVRRKLTYHMTQTFLPSTLLVILTWLTFLLPVSLLEVRIGVLMTVLLTMTNKFESIRNYTPNVSYVKAIDIYMMSCVSIVFITLLQLAFLYWMRKGHLEYLEDSRHMKQLIKSKPVDTEAEQKKYEEENEMFLIRTRMIVERYGFLLTIVWFTVFNIVFWPWIFISSNYYGSTIDYRFNSL